MHYGLKLYSGKLLHTLMIIDNFTSIALPFIFSILRFE